MAWGAPRYTKNSFNVVFGGRRGGLNFVLQTEGGIFGSLP
jgi:hypothetical protein